MMPLENDQQKYEISNLLSLSVSFFALACERTFITTHSIEIRDAIGPENILFASFSPEILQAGAVKRFRKRHLFLSALYWIINHTSETIAYLS